MLVLRYSIFIFLFVFLQISCSNSEPQKLEAKVTIGRDTVCHFLIFKKEQKAELWGIGKKNIFLDSFQIKNLPQLPIGQFEMTFDKKTQVLKIQFPNEFYRSKNFKNLQYQDWQLGIENLSEIFFNNFENAQISKVVIFPSDNRLGGELAPCFACPHWMAELYTFLNLKKKEYN